MAKFIRLTATTGEVFYVNVDDISQFGPPDAPEANATIIARNSRHEVQVKETIEQIAELIHND